MKTKPSGLSLVMFVVVGALCSAEPVVAQVAGGASTVGKFQDLIISPDANVSDVNVGAGGFVGIGRHDVAGAVRDFWAAGVSLDFIEEATQHLQPGKVALVVEIEEDWVIPVDSALETAGGRVFRRTRSEVAEAQFDHDIAAFKSEIQELESEASPARAHASGVAKQALAV